MFNIEKNLLKKIFKSGTPAISENSDELVAYANENLDLKSEEYLESYPELKALPFDPILHALFWGFVEGRKNIRAKGGNELNKVLFLANSFYAINHAYFFDKEYIAQQVGADSNNFDYFDAIFKYCESWINNSPVNPNRYFNSAYTGSLYGIDSSNKQNPAVLFLLGAEVEETIQGGGSFYKGFLKKRNSSAVTNFHSKSPKLFFLSHGAGRTGACLNAFYTAAALREAGLDVIFLYIQGGELEQEIRSRIPAIKIESEDHFSNVLKELSFTHGVINTVTLGAYARIAKQQSIPTVTLVHEWSTSILSFGWSASASEVAASSNRIICSSNRGRDDFLKSFPNISAKTYVLPQGDYLGHESFGDRIVPPIFNWLREKFDKIVVISGYFDTRKGFDLLPQLILECNKLEKDSYCFVHIGDTAPHLSQWVQDDLRKSGCDTQVYFLGKVTNPIDYFSHADAMALPSREDPLPTVVMEATNAGLPVVLFDKSTGFTPESYPVEFEQKLINAAPYLDVPHFAQTLRGVLNNKKNNSSHGAFDFETYINELRLHILDISQQKIDSETISDQSANISCVVVFHNQARYAWLRLLSIAQQSIPPKQLIIIDDASTDEIQKDLDILVPILKRRISKVSIVRNELNNSGKNTVVNLYRVLDEVTEDWIWICEGDDFSSTDFLEKAVPHLDEGVSLYYCDSTISNDQGFPVGDYSNYYNDLPTEQFSKSYRRSGNDENSDWLGIKNTIPNMSAVIVAKDRVRDIEISNYSNAYGCGDWRFYREILKKGDIAFNSERLNFHRRHETSVFGNEKNKIKNECELIEYQTEIFNQNEIFSSVHHLVLREMQNRPPVGLEADARKDFLIGRIQKIQDKKLSSVGKSGILFVLPDFGSGGGQLVALDIANEYARKKEFAVYVCSARGHFGLSRTVLRRVSADIIILDNNEVSPALIKKLGIEKIQSHVYWADKYVYERGLHEVASWCISLHGCYNDFMNRKAAYKDFVPLDQIGEWFDSSDFIQVCAEKHFDAIQHFSPNSLPKSKLIWNGLYADMELIHNPKTPVENTDRIERSSINLVMTGRWEPSKGWRLLKDAYSILKRSNQKNLGKCYLIGPSISELNSAWGNEWNYGDFIVTGEISQPMSLYGSQLFVGVLPSYFHSESQPRVVSEFFLNAIPVVTSEAGDLKGLINGSGSAPGGITIPISGPNQDPHDLAAALAVVLDEHKIFSEAAKIRFDKYLDIRKSVAEIEKCWNAKCTAK